MFSSRTSIRRKSKPLDFRVNLNSVRAWSTALGHQLRGDQASVLSDGVEFPLHDRLIDEAARHADER